MRAKTAYALLAAAPPPRRSAADQEAPPQGAQEEPSSQEQPRDVTITLRRDQAQAIRLAIPAFRLTTALSPQAAAAARELEATARQDLLLSGYFVIQGPADFGGLRLSGDPAQDLEQYRSLGNQILLVGDVREEGGKVVFEGRLFDLASGRAILAKRYPGAFSAAGRLGHTL